MDAAQQQYEFFLDEAVQKWRTLTANEGVLVENEFKKLRQYDPNRTTIATNPRNKPKNRYGLVYPYDEDFCRVCLTKKTHDQSDYINASIIRCIPPDQISASNSRVFFAAQGPVEQTLDDFIRMIIEQQITIIVMLSFVYDPITTTYAQEHASYFSDKINNRIETKFYTISMGTISFGYRYIRRRLQIQSKSSDFVYNCDQYHYPHFVDKGVPGDYHSMIGLITKLREINDQNHRILVHCSAGVGRTGVFISLYYLLDAIERQQKLNVKYIVDTIRLYRPHLVQTIEQYEYIYRCLAEIAIHPYDGRALDQFVDYSNKLLPSAQLTNSPIYCAYQNRNNRVESETYFTMISAQQHLNHNRNKHFIPYDRNRVILHSPSESTYINASKITNPFATGAIILTQEPMKTTLQPFFSMLLQEHKNFIVAIEEIEKPSYVTTKFISRTGINVDILPVSHSNNKFGAYYRSHQIKVNDNIARQSDLFVFEYMGSWTMNGTYLPVNLEQFVRFVDRSIYHQRKIDPIRLGLVVHDRDGGSKAAFYCIVQNLIDRLLIDGRVALENFVTDVCQRRVNALISLEQYIALHQIVTIWSSLKRRGALECTVNTGRT